jgi:parallel beta-helix repeat protein
MVVEDFRFSRALRTVEESLAHYNSNDYHVVDADTVIIEPFNGTMRQFMGMVTNKDQYEGNDGLSVMSLNFMGIPSGYYGKTNGIFMQDASSSDVAYCSATGFAQAGIRLEHCSNSKVMNCDCKDIVGDAISLCAATHCLVSGNIVDGASTGIDVTYDHTVEPSVQSDNVVVSGNICKGCDVGIKVSSGLYCSVNGNTCIENKTGMELDGNFCSFSNNICKLNLQEGVFLDGEDCDFVGNLIIANSQNGDLDYPGIEMNISDRNNVQHNVVRYDATKRHTYGIIIDGDSNVVTNNDLLNSGGMGAIIDNGTSTKTTAGNRTA